MTMSKGMFGRFRHFLRPVLGAVGLAVVMAGTALPTPVSAQGSVAYVRGTGDVPLMPGLSMLPDTGMVFETPGGRLVEAFAQGRVAPSDVLTFYRATLPQMGWRAVSEGSFRRDGETLDLEFTGEAPNLTVRFSLAPGG